MAGCVLLALLVRLIALPFESIITEDGAYYLLLAEHLREGDFTLGFSTYWSPLYPLLIGFASIFFQDLEFAARMVSILCGALLVVFVYLLIRFLYAKDAAWIGAGLIAIYPSLIQYSVMVLTESIFALLFTCAVLAGWLSLSRSNVKAFLLTGAAFGACYLVKPESIAFIFLMIGLTFIASIINKIPTRKTARHVAALLFGCALLAAPYLFYLRAQTGGWTISEKMFPHVASPVKSTPHWKTKWLLLSSDKQTTLADSLWGGKRAASFDETPPVELEVNQSEANPSEASQWRISWSVSRTLRGVRDGLRNLLRLFPPLLILLCGLMFFKTRWTKARLMQEIYLSSFIVSSLLGYALLQMAKPKYLVMLMPLLICWVAQGIVELERLFAKLLRSESQVFKCCRQVFITACVALTLVPKIIFPVAHRAAFQSLELLPVIAWMNERELTKPRIMATSPVVPYYVGGEHFYLPDEDFAVVIDYACRKKIDYIVIDERNVNKVKNSTSRFLLDERVQHADLHLIYKNDDSPRHKVLVFKLTANDFNEREAQGVENLYAP